MTQPENTPRCVLALDLGTTTGWAIREYYCLTSAPVGQI